MSRGIWAALRIARRDAVRSRGRSALVIAMVALPITAMTSLAVLAWSAEWDPDERVTRAMGAADAVVTLATTRGPVTQDPGSLDHAAVLTPDGAPARSADAVSDPRSVVPPGARTIVQSDVDVVVRTAGGEAPTTLRELDYGDPMLAGLLRQSAGIAPSGPGEVAVTPALLERTGLRVGDRLELVKPAARATIVGVARPYGDPDRQLVLALPGTLAPGAERRDTTVYVDTPEPIRWDTVKEWNRRGVVAFSRAVALDPPPSSDVRYDGARGGERVTVAAVIVVVGVLAGLEVVLLAGAAFAVGARRQARALALVAAAGGESRHVRAVVLTGGLVLGACGAALGVMSGLAIAAMARPPAARLAGVDLGRFDVHVLPLLPLAGFGVAVGLAAAALPARAAAGADVIAALAGRRGVVRTQPRVPVIGVLLAAAGVVATLAGSGLALGLSERSAGSMGPLGTLSAALIGLGAVAAQIGLIVTTPAIVGGLARLGRALPLAPRLAVRDAARHRSRTAPAVAAVLAAVTGATALTLYVAALDAKDRRDYTASLPTGYAEVELMAWEVTADGRTRSRRGDAAAAVRVVESTLPVAQASAISVVDQMCAGGDCRTVTLVRPPANACPLDAWYEQHDGTAPPPEVKQQHRGDWRCQDYFDDESRIRVIRGSSYGFLVGDTTTLTAIGVPHDDAAAAALARGGIVVFDRRDIDSGKATLQGMTLTDAGTGVSVPTGPPVVVAAVALAPPERLEPAALLSPQAARLLAVSYGPAKVTMRLHRLPTEAEEDAARAGLRTAGAPDQGLYVERGYMSAYGLGLLALALASALVTLGATGVATGLAQADARPDYATLAAIGASPGLRRRLAMWQAVCVAGLGSVLGVLAGAVPALGLIRADASMDAVLPWGRLAVIVLGIPLVAAVCAGLFVRSRLPIHRQEVA